MAPTQIYNYENYEVIVQNIMFEEEINITLNFASWYLLCL